MSTITCPSCKTIAPPGAIFCDHCGYDLRTVTPIGGGEERQSAEEQSPPPVEPVAGAPAEEQAILEQGATTYGVDTGEIACPVCQHLNLPGSAFCENCGAQLAQLPVKSASEAAAPEMPPPVAVPAETPPANYLTGRLMIQATGTTLLIPAGKQVVVIGREDPVSGVFPDIDLDPHGGHEAGVGRRHAQILAQSGMFYIVDLDSVNGTVVNRQKLAPHQLQPLKDGDELHLGKMVLIYFSS